MQDRNNEKWRTPIPNPTVTCLRSMPSMQPMRPSGSSNTPDLRMFRHPAPISSERALLADHRAKIPKPTKATSLAIISSDTQPVDKEPVIEQDTIQTEECDVSSKSKTPVEKGALSNDSESPVQMKHKLPFTAVPHKGSYFKMPTNPINKENMNSSPQTKTDQAMQTETCRIVTEEDYKMVQIINNNDLTIKELVKQLEKNEKEKQDKNNSQLIIDLESSPEEDSQDLFEKVMKQSTKNKSVLNKIVKILHRNKGLTNVIEKQGQFPFPAAEAGATDDVSQHPSHTHNTFEPNDIQKAFALITMLLQTVFPIVRIKPQSQDTQTEDAGENNKKRKLHTTVEEDQSANEIGPFEQNVQPCHELPTLMVQQQEMPMFRAPNPARQQQYAPEHIERSTQFYPNMSSVPHEHTPYPSQRNHSSSTTAANRSYQLSTGTATFNTPQTPVQMSSPVQMHINDPRRQTLYRMLKAPRLPRVFSTHEANMHGSQAQQSWNYAHYYNTHGNMYPQGNQ